MKPVVVVYMCDQVRGKIVKKRLEQEGAEVQLVATIEDLLTKGTTKPVKGVLADLNCALSPKELIAGIAKNPVLHKAFRAVYSDVLTVDEIEAIKKEKIHAVYIGSLMSMTEIVDHLMEEMDA